LVGASRSAFRRTALPLASYYVVTLALPIANGAAQSDAFVEHAQVVLMVPPAAIIFACAVYTAVHALGRACPPVSNRQERQLKACGSNQRCA
jgi:hypothetical protein